MTLSRHTDIKRMAILVKLIRLTEMIKQHSAAKITTQEGGTKNIKTKVGVRQGDSLSTNLFNIVLDGGIKQS